MSPPLQGVPVSLKGVQVASEMGAWWWPFTSDLGSGAGGAHFAGVPISLLHRIRIAPHLNNCGHPSLAQARPSCVNLHAGRLHDGVLLYRTIGPKHHQQQTLHYHGMLLQSFSSTVQLCIGCVHARHMKASKTDFLLLTESDVFNQILLKLGSMGCSPQASVCMHMRSKCFSRAFYNHQQHQILHADCGIATYV